MDVPDIPPDSEALIQKQIDEFREVRRTAEMRQREPGAVGIDPGGDPIAREALVRLMEENMERAMAKHTVQDQEGEPIAEESQETRLQFRDQVKAFFARHEKAAGIQQK